MKYKVLVELEVETEWVMPKEEVSNLVIKELFANQIEIFKRGYTMAWVDVRTSYKENETTN